MAFPNAPDFASGTADGVWWNTRASGTIYRCATSANTFTRLLQDFLRATIASRTASYDGTNVIGSDVVSDGIWGPTTQRALYVALRGAGAPEALTESVRLEGQARALGRPSAGAAIWLLHRNGFGPVPPATAADALLLSEDTVPPRWGVLPPVTELPPTGIFCVAQSADTGTGTTTTTVPDASTTTTPDPGTGVPVPDPPPTPTAPITLPLPPGITVPTAPRAANSPVTWVLVGAVVLALGGITWIAVQTARRAKEQE